MKKISPNVLIGNAFHDAPLASGDFDGVIVAVNFSQSVLKTSQV